MAWRETRGAWRHFLYFFACIAIGVGALVGVSLFSTHVERAVTKEARGMLGGDLEIRLTHALSLAGHAVLQGLGERKLTFTHVSELVAMAARTTHGPASNPIDPNHRTQSRRIDVSPIWSGPTRPDAIA
jgi:Predicted ABC-type transport system involved in lysophospholipase L1 biosynthesis, permease component